ncbi:AraC family transcriptional regulator [Enterococcus sp. LJL128]|uniref:AraC family transcriptional regulator n=1 Tax=Enterococcus sp. LJL51 TaxID=3416656 RepID=UPI003CF2D987
MMEHFDQVLSYIEKQLKGEINSQKIARISGCTFASFQKMFSYIVGIPLSEYIRRRKMSRAVFDLLEGKKILTVSKEYGYHSPTAFNRAFQSIHGFPPSEVVHRKEELTIYPRLRLSLSVSGGEQFQYRLEEKPTLFFVGKKYPLSSDIERNFHEVPFIWQNFMGSELEQQLVEYRKQNQSPIFGIAVAEKAQPAHYYIGVFKQLEADCPDGLEELVLPAQRWLLLKGQGSMPEAVQQLYRRFYQEWLPVSAYEYELKTDVEVYPSQQEMHSSQSCELWLPIRRKELSNE